MNKISLKKPNCIIIVLDTARAQNFSIYGYERITTPFLNELSKESMIFENCYSTSPWTLPSHASIFTGLYSSEHGIHGGNFYMNSYNYDNLPEILKKVGYETSLFSSNLWISDEFGFNRGMKHLFKGWQFYDQDSDLKRNLRLNLNNEEKIKSVIMQFLQGNILKNFVNAIYGKFIFRNHTFGSDNLNNKIGKWLKQRNKERPFFMFINYLDCHLPYLPPKSLRFKFIEDNITWKQLCKINQNAMNYHMGITEMSDEKFYYLRALYDSEIYYSDYLVKQIFDLIVDLNIIDNTIFIVTSDHGDNIGEHNLMSHKFSLHNTLIKVPLLIRYPKMFKKGEITDIFVQLNDILPTLIDILGIKEINSPRDIYSHSILKKINNSNRIAYSEYLNYTYTSEYRNQNFDFINSRFNKTIQSIINDNFKYIKASNHENEFYDLKNDPYEEINQIEFIDKKTIKKYENLLSKFKMNLKNRDIKNSGTDVDKVVKEQLKNLGYL